MLCVGPFIESNLLLSHDFTSNQKSCDCDVWVGGGATCKRVICKIWFIFVIPFSAISVAETTYFTFKYLRKQVKFYFQYFWSSLFCMVSCCEQQVCRVSMRSRPVGQRPLQQKPLALRDVSTLLLKRWIGTTPLQEWTTWKIKHLLH